MWIRGGLHKDMWGSVTYREMVPFDQVTCDTTGGTPVVLLVHEVHVVL
jgi:hypothetical protein